MTIHFGIKKTRELIAKKYFLLIFCEDIKVYIKSCDVYLISKTVLYKRYEDL